MCINELFEEFTLQYTSWQGKNKRKFFLKKIVNIWWQRESNPRRLNLSLKELPAVIVRIKGRGFDSHWHLCPNFFSQ